MRKSLSLLMLALVLFLGACGTTQEKTNGDAAKETAVNGAGGEEQAAEENSQATQEEAAAEQEEKDVQTAEVTFNGMVDNNSIEVEHDGEAMVLQTAEVSGVDFSTINPGDKATIVFYENSDGQMMLTSFQNK